MRVGLASHIRSLLQVFYYSLSLPPSVFFSSLSTCFLQLLQIRKFFRASFRPPNSLVFVFVELLCL